MTPPSGPRSSVETKAMRPSGSTSSTPITAMEGARSPALCLASLMRGCSFDEPPNSVRRQGEAHRLTLAKARAAPAAVLLADAKAHARREPDVISGVRPLIDDLIDRAGERPLPRRRKHGALGPHSEDHLVTHGSRLIDLDLDAGEDAKPGGPDAPRLDEIGIADEIGDEACGRPLVNFRGRSELKDLAGVHDGDPVRHRQRLMLIMSDEDEGDADL